MFFSILNSLSIDIDFWKLKFWISFYQQTIVIVNFQVEMHSDDK
jgi:hypothetical protein